MPTVPVPPAERSTTRWEKASADDWQTISAKAEAQGWPVPDEDWGQTARTMYQSLYDSGMSSIYDSSDRATAWLLCKMIDQAEQKGALHRAGTMTAIMDALGRLGATVAARRQMRVQLEQADPTAETARAEVLAALLED